jgi:hypothetical protein
MCLLFIVCVCLLVGGGNGKDVKPVQLSTHFEILGFFPFFSERIRSLKEIQCWVCCHTPVISATQSEIGGS